MSVFVCGGEGAGGRSCVLEVGVERIVRLENWLEMKNEGKTK